MFEKDNYCFGCVYWRPSGCGSTTCFKSADFIEKSERKESDDPPVVVVFTTKSKHLPPQSNV